MVLRGFREVSIIGLLGARCWVAGLNNRHGWGAEFVAELIRESGFTGEVSLRTVSLPSLAAVALVGATLIACSEAPPTLGPVDGFDLPPTDLERVHAGVAAPDFTLQAFTGESVTLSDYRGVKNVVLVFYRGHW